jgi:hypothetical protein
MARVSQPTQPPPPQLWKGPLIAGVCFGLAYGVTQRLLSFNVTELIRFGRGFDVQVFPGTSLESLKLRFGDTQAEIRGDLELQELERQQEQQATQRAEDAKQAEAELQRANQSDPEREPELPAAPPAPAAEPVSPPQPTPPLPPAP